MSTKNNRLKHKLFKKKKNRSTPEPRILIAWISSNTEKYGPFILLHPHLQYSLSKDSSFSISFLLLCEFLLIILAYPCSLPLKWISSHYKSVKLFPLTPIISVSIDSFDLVILCKLSMNSVSVSTTTFFDLTKSVESVSPLKYLRILNLLRDNL